MTKIDAFIIESAQNIGVPIYGSNIDFKRICDGIYESLGMVSKERRKEEIEAARKAKKW